MTIHINAKPGQIAETILLPGDPLRAKYVADNFLEDVERHNDVRGMYGYTGTYKGKRVSVQGTGMGMPSISIYVHELINEYGVKNLIRIGSCGAFQPDLKLRDLVLAQAASTESSMNRIRFNGMDFAPTADFDLLLKAYNEATARGANVRVGNVLSGDTFYYDNPDDWHIWAKFGVLVVEMETAALYTLAAKFGVKALAIMTVSDSLVHHQAMSSEDRETSLRQMIEIGLSLA
ncbi:MAG: purine-nucleoside phosphorylase [Chloroflexota bacterium]